MSGTRRCGGCAWLWRRPAGSTDPVIGSTIIRNFFFCREVAGNLASGVLEADRAGVP